MIINGKLLRGEQFTDAGVFTCVITKEEFLECYNAWVKPAERDDALPELSHYSFERDAFVSTFEQVFTDNEIANIEVMCQQHTTLNEFLLFCHSDREEFSIIHLPSWTIINWYKHLGRTNTCNKENFSIEDLKNFLERLKVDINEHTAS